MIETRDLTKKYGELFAIHKIDLKLDRGRRVRLHRPQRRRQDDHHADPRHAAQPHLGRGLRRRLLDLHQAPEIRRLIGYMPDFFGVYDDMKVIEYLEFFAAAYRIKGAAAPQDLRRSARAGRPRLQARSASSPASRRGMTQRLGLARVLLHDPQVLLLDEPASGLDPRARIEIRGAAQSSFGNMGKTIMVSSHILPELADICNKIGIIEQGELLVNDDVADGDADGPPGQMVLQHRRRGERRRRGQACSSRRRGVEKVEAARRPAPRHAHPRRPRPQRARQAAGRKRPRPHAAHRGRNQPRNGVHGAHEGDHVVRGQESGVRSQMKPPTGIAGPAICDPHKSP